MMLDRPPVTQTWIGFTFDHSPRRRPWDIQEAEEFLKRFETSLPHREAIFATHYEIQDISPVHRPKIMSIERQLDNARARNEEETHWLSSPKTHWYTTEHAEKEPTSVSSH